MMRRRAFLAVPSIVLAGALTACSRRKEMGPPERIEIDLAATPDTLDKLAKESAVIAIGKTNGTRISNGATPPYSWSEFNVSRTLKGKVPEGIIHVFQSGNGTTYVAMLPPVMAHNTEYLVFLDDRFDESDKPRQLQTEGPIYGIVGTGVYARTQGDEFALDPLTEAPPDMPKIVDTARVEKAIKDGA